MVGSFGKLMRTNSFIASDAEGNGETKCTVV